MGVTGNDQTRSGENCTQMHVGAFASLEAFQIPSLRGFYGRFHYAVIID